MTVSKTYELHRDVVTSVVNTSAVGQISQFSYFNDGVGRRIERVDFPSTGNVFSYNTRAELTEAIMGTNAYIYNYDAIGNRTDSTHNFIKNNYAVNQLNQFTNINNGAISEPLYDEDGNIVALNGWTFTWSAENRLVTATDSTTTISNSYDYMGRRLRKVVNGKPSIFLYDGWAMIREKSTATNFFMYGLDVSGSPQEAGTIGGILMASFGGTNVFYCYDANGNVENLVDSSGNVVAHYEYSPYGLTTAKTGELADENPFRFSTKYLDVEPNLYYYGYRFYNSWVGRWIARDPLHELAFRHLTQYITPFNYPEGFDIPIYAFTQNDPINSIDIAGLYGRGQIPCGNCTICIDRNTSGDGQSPYHIHWNCGRHGRPRACRGGGSAYWPSGKGREGSSDIPKNIVKCIEKTRWNLNHFEVSVPTTGNCCKNETIHELVYARTAVGVCVVIYGVYKVVKVCAGGTVGFLAAGPPGSIVGISLCLATP